MNNDEEEYAKKRLKESKGLRAENPCRHATLKTASEFPSES
jgi:hypothetical protein